jgi:lysophospholipase L1-like esterase
MQTAAVRMTRNRVMSLVLGALTLAALLPGALRAGADPLLKPGERMVFLGDSITEQRCYTRYVMNYFTLRYPGSTFSFLNAGWSGDTAPGALNRLERDVLSLKPDVVSICFGMNDGGYRAFEPALYDRYMAGMSGLVARLKAAGVQIVLLTPGCVDPDHRDRANGLLYNQTLTRYAQGIKELAARESLPVGDLNTLMLDVQSRAKADNPAFTLIPDSVHPSPPGQAVMAFGLLTALGCTNPASGATIDAAARQCVTDRCTIKNLQVSSNHVTFLRADDALPTFLDPDAAPVLKYLPFTEQINPYRLTVTGLGAGDWNIVVEGVPVATFTAAELARGVNLGAKPGPWMDMGSTVNRLSREQEQVYFTRWRQVQLGLTLPDLQAEKKSMLQKLDELVTQKESARIQATTPREWRWILTRKSAPGTAP